MVGSAPLLGPLVALNAWTLTMEAWVSALVVCYPIRRTDTS